MAFRVKRLGIAGVGLIGGSLGLAARQSGLADHVLGIGRSESRLATAAELGAVDSWTTDFASGARECDVLYLSAPVSVIIEQLRQLSSFAKTDLIVTDAGSTKAAILAAAAGLPPGIRFVGGHPMAGSEESGVEAASAGLFGGATYVLTPDAGTDPDALAAVTSLVKALAARPVVMGAGEHDAAVAVISHLPHFLAGALVRMADLAGEGVGRLAAGSFRDMTRVASSPPVLWRDIALTNRKSILSALRGFRKALAEAERVLDAGDEAAVEAWFQESCARRKRLPVRKEEP